MKCTIVNLYYQRVLKQQIKNILSHWGAHLTEHKDRLDKRQKSKGSQISWLMEMAGTFLQGMSYHPTIG